MTNRMGFDPRDILAAWAVPQPVELRPTDVGTNNLSRFVDTAAGSYFLRIYQNTADPVRIRYEHAVLLELQKAALPFSVPRPLTTLQGDTYATLGPPDDPTIAALFPVIAGRHPKRGSVADANACGEALATLHLALADIEMNPAPLWSYGNLGQVHPMVPDPLSMLAHLLIDNGGKTRLRALFVELLTQIPDLYDRLPRQLIHADFGRSNALLHHGRVSGVLDFEFASPDLRAMDFAVALWSFGIGPWQSERDWALIDALVAGYQRHITLTVREVTMLPVLLRLREATSLVHWIGRLRQGLTTSDDIAERADRMLHVDLWLQVNATNLIRRVEQAMRFRASSG